MKLPSQTHKENNRIKKRLIEQSTDETKLQSVTNKSEKELTKWLIVESTEADLQLPITPNKVRPSRKMTVKSCKDTERPTSKYKREATKRLIVQTTPQSTVYVVIAKETNPVEGMYFDHHI
jgi:hypothetical protein